MINAAMLAAGISVCLPTEGKITNRCRVALTAAGRVSVALLRIVTLQMWVASDRNSTLDPEWVSSTAEGVVADHRDH